MNQSNPYGLTTWTTPDNYVGENPEGDFIVATVSRDSDILEQSNFHSMKADLEADPENSDHVYVLRTSHWACGWIDFLLCRKEAPVTLQGVISKMLDAISDYPIYDDSNYTELRMNETEEAWCNMSLDDRIELCRDSGVSIMAARHNYLPENNGELEEYLLE